MLLRYAGSRRLSAVSSPRHPHKGYPMSDDPERRFPIQNAGTVPWSAAEKAYEGYAAAGHGSQSLERVAQRGGFGVGEFAVLYQGLAYNDARFEDRVEPATVATAIELGADWDVTGNQWLKPNRKRHP